MDKPILVSGSAPLLYPTETLFGVLFYSDNEGIEIPQCHPFQGEWGEILSNHLTGWEATPMPRELCIVYLSIVEKKFYNVDAILPYENLQCLWNNAVDEAGSPMFTHIVIGMAPYGHVAVWVRGQKKSRLVNWIKGSEISIDMKDFMPMEPLITLEEYCNHYIEVDSKVKANIEAHGLHDIVYFNKLMQQFNYRYWPQFGRWNKENGTWDKIEDAENYIELEFLEEVLFDGTHDKLHDGNLLNYHLAGIPNKLAIKWHIKKSDYTAYLWFEDEKAQLLFDRFYGNHPETKTDFMIRIDSEKNKYELALYRYGLKEPQVISESAYQLLVFKNKFEYYRSENYSQPKGAWIW